MELGNAYLAALRLPALLGGHADALADELDESVSLAVADRDGIRFIHQATRRRAMSLSFRIGDLLPAERTAPATLFATEWTEADWQRWRAPRGGPARPRLPGRTPARTPLGRRRLRAPHGAGGGARLGAGRPVDRTRSVAVSVPVRDPRTGRIACVANVVSHTSRHTAADLRDTLLERLRATVSRMEDDLRTAPPPEPEPAPEPSGLAAWTGASKQRLGREFVESLARGLTVLTAFGEGRSALTLTDVANATGLARATARRALITYEHLGLVTPGDDPRTFTPTPRVLSLGFPPLSRTTLPELATPHLAELSARVHESASLAVLTDSGSGPEIQYTARVATTRVMSVNITVGTRLPAYATSLGRVMLADAPPPPHALGTPQPLTPRTVTDPQTLTRLLPRIRTQGYALTDEELEEGLRSIAVPIRDRTGHAVAAVNVATHAARRTVEECVRDILPELRRTADRIEDDLSVAGRFTRVPPS